MQLLNTILAASLWDAEVKSGESEPRESVIVPNKRLMIVASN